MIRKLGVCLVLWLLVGSAFAQVNTSLGKSALKAIQKQRWDKAEDKLNKSLRKDSLNPLAHYGWSIFYFKEINPLRDLDKAYLEVIRAARDFQNSSHKWQQRLRKIPLDSQRIVLLRKAIDSVTFKTVKQKNQEQIYIKFLEQHPFAEQRTEAIALRDEVAFMTAVNTNTYESFLAYLKKYPSSAYAAAAQKRYEKLVYESMTREGTLEAYDRFLREHPNTPFLSETEKNIFELFTLSGDPEKFLSFSKTYPHSHEIKRSKDILFHLLLEKEGGQMPVHLLSDSLKQILELQEYYLVPFLKGSRFGFMNKNGIQVIPPITEELNEDYVCGNINEDIIVLPNGLIARNGKTFFNGSISEVDDIGGGYLLVEQGECHLLLHKSGFVLDSCTLDAKNLGNRFLSVTKNNQKKILISLAGRKILPDQFDDIALFGNIIALKQDNVWNLLTLSELLTYSTRGNKLFARSFDEIASLDHGLLWAKGNGNESVLDQDLREIIPLENHSIQKTFFGFTTQSVNGFSLYTLNGKRSSYFDNVKINQPWVAVSKSGERSLFNVETQKFIGEQYDTMFFEGPFAIGERSDTTIVHFSESVTVAFNQPADFKFLPGKDSTSFLTITTEEPVANQRHGKSTKTIEKTAVYNSKGKRLFSETFDDIHVAGNDLFIIIRKDKKALVNVSGKILLPFEYDAIGSVNGNTVSVLKSMHFGLYNTRDEILIKPAFDKNIFTYGDQFIVVYKDGLYGITTWDKMKELKPEFEEVREWNDSVALVKRNQLWALYDIDKKTFIESNIKALKMVNDNSSEKVAIVERDDSFGVISNRRGIIIPITFSDLANVGSPEEPLFFTEKHVAEASIFVVIYYDRNGKLVRREIYEQTEDYEKIYCGGR